MAQHARFVLTFEGIEHLRKIRTEFNPANDKMLQEAMADQPPEVQAATFELLRIEVDQMLVSDVLASTLADAAIELGIQDEGHRDGIKAKTCDALGTMTEECDRAYDAVEDQPRDIDWQHAIDGFLTAASIAIRGEDWTAALSS